jgi:deoxyribose-phosphate aldolase
MRANCSEKVQVKAAGGVRDLDGLIKVRDLGCTRCGASATVKMLDAYKGVKTGAVAAGDGY